MSIPPSEGAAEEARERADGLEAELSGRFYVELRGIARRLFAGERGAHTLQPTALVNEACVRLLSTSRLTDLPREQRLALAARVLRQVLVDHARARGAEKRGAGRVRVELDPDRGAGEDALEDVDVDRVHTALERLAGLHARQAEVVTLRLFGGLTMEQVAASVGAAKRTVEADWTVARAWLRRELAP
jgi:RNA polymerase sigma factor (TIGR02999 family)